MKDIKLTQYSHGAGCGCKISPKNLDIILHSEMEKTAFPQLLVGYQSKDDAAVFDLGNGSGVISTTDFFMPIVDDPFDFGRIAATNAISDVYAMGGTPMMAVAILGWPINTLPPEIASKVVDGGRKACLDAGIPLAGGHSIDCPEPVFGLAVTGLVPLTNVKQNDKATAGCSLFLSKPLGVGILTTAQKKGVLLPEHTHIATNWMTTLNKSGAQFGGLPYVKAMTDVTGFGLGGHLLEMCEGSNLYAEIDFHKIPIIEETNIYLAQQCIPGGTNRNWDSYGNHISLQDKNYQSIICDPQTSGGLLVAVEEKEAFIEFCRNNHIDIWEIGHLSAQVRDKRITIL
ncbi:MAG: selenide, water dikinase SelD [Chitinophagales bacterium]|nr:selenide, water dikinase SelD [Chitinophagales bacterium]